MEERNHGQRNNLCPQTRKERPLLAYRKSGTGAALIGAVNPELLEGGVRSHRSDEARSGQDDLGSSHSDGQAKDTELKRSGVC